VLALAAVLLLGATFLGLRTTGPVRDRARGLAVGLAAAGGLAGLVTAVVTGVLGHGFGLVVAVVATGLLALVALAARAGREGLAFALSSLATAAAVVTVFTHQLAAGHQVVLASTLDSAWSLTMSGSAAAPSALRLISVVGVVVLPGVLIYQGYSYWVFRHRISSGRTA
jgi:cytochrome d ubiquinol oxidase subunit II